MKETYYPELDETVLRETLPCGLRVEVVPRKGFTKKLAYLAADFGSIHTDFLLDGQEHHAPAGTAHYLEHKLFDMPDGSDISREFAALGASVNAFTSYDITAYYFSCTEHFGECLDLLIRFVTTPCFSEESVASERGIIDQEIGMNLDSPDSMLFDSLSAAMYKSHPIGVPILGTRESIREITPEVLETSHRAFYAPENLLLCVVGDVDGEEVCRIAQNILGSARREAGRKLRPWQEAMTISRPHLERTMDVAMPSFILGFKSEPVGTGEDAIRQEMVADLAAEALFGESSELYLQLYQAGTIDASFGGGFESADGCALLTCSGDSRTPEAVRDAVLARAEAMVRTGIPQDFFLRMKRSALGRRIRALDSFDATCFRVCAYRFSDFDYFRFPEIYRVITKEEITDFLSRTVTAARSCMSVILPTSQEDSL